MDGWYSIPLNNSSLISGDVYATAPYWFYYQNGQPYTGWVQREYQWSYVENGSAKRNVFILDYSSPDSPYLLDDNGLIPTTAGWYLGGTPQDEYTESNDWHTEYEYSWYYLNADGSFATGWKMKDGKWYYLSNYNYCSVRHYVMDNGKYYIFDDSFEWVTTPGWYKDVFYVNNDGTLATGWKQKGSDWYYLMPYMVKDYYACDNGKYYLFDEDGKWFTTPGWHSFHWDMESCYVNNDGTLATGWKQDGSDWYYLDPYVVKRLLYIINGSFYYFDESGVMQTGKQLVSYYSFDQIPLTIKTKEFTFGADGAMILSPGMQEIAGDTYYILDNGSLANGWFQVKNKWYYADPVDYTVLLSSWKTIDGQIYRFNASGEMVTGWYWSDYFKNWYYLGSDGALKTGWQKINGVWYYLDEYMYTNWQQIDGSWYYFGSDGAMRTGWKQIGGSWYYFGSDGAMKSGWQQVGSTWYYLGSDGSMKTGWKQISGSWYYFGSDGAMRSGWQNIGGSWYYFNNTMVTGWKQIGGTWYYFQANGAMAAGETLSIGGTYYSFAASGAWIQ